MKKIDRYLLTEILGPFGGGLIFFSFIFLMFQSLRLAESFIVHGAPGGVLLKITGLFLVSFLPISLPLAFLISILVGFGRLSADSELVAMKANGMSLWRLTKPVLWLGVLVALVSSALYLEWVPQSSLELSRTITRLTNTKAVAAIREGTFTSGFFDLLIYADKVDSRTNRMSKVFIYDERNPQNPLTVVAKDGELVPVKSESSLGSSAALKLYSGNIHSIDIEENTYKKVNFREYNLFLKVEAGSDDTSIKPKAKPFHTLRKIIKTEPNPKMVLEYEAEIWRRHAMALAPLFFVFLGIGFGTARTRAVRSGATLITLATIVPYWMLQAGCIRIVHMGLVPAALGLMIPNLILGIIGYRAFKSSSW